MNPMPEVRAVGSANSWQDRLQRLASLFEQHGQPRLTRRGGRIVEVAASHIRVAGLARDVELGACVEIDNGADSTFGEVIGIQRDVVSVKLFAASPRIGLGAPVWLRNHLQIRPSTSWLGRVINAIGDPIDNKGPLPVGSSICPLDRVPLAPLNLERVQRPCPTGIKAIDLFTPICIGQRIGVFSGTGVGKSTLISMLTRATTFKTIVVALVAERSREVREFIEDVIEPGGARAVTVVATSAESPVMRKLAAKTAMSIAEHFRDAGDDVLLVVDSLTRYAHALREIALAAGEPPVARGYAPSVFAELPQLLERAGPGTPTSGSITGVFTVLVDGDDHNDPVADTVRGILDGHIVLDRAIADQGRYPAINPLSSISRLAGHVWSSDEASLVRRLRSLVARYEDSRELRAMGAYKAGADAELDQAVLVTPLLYQLMTQLPGDPPCKRVFEELANQLTAMKARDASQQPLDQRPPTSARPAEIT